MDNLELGSVTQRGTSLSDCVIEKSLEKQTLYNVSHYGYFFDVILHAVKNHPYDRNILLIDESWLSPETSRYVHSLQHIIGFDKFIFYNESKIRKKSSLQVEDLVKYFDIVLNKTGRKIEDYDCIYSGFDTIHGFGIYLNYKQVNYMLFDDNLVTSTKPSDTIFDKSPYHELLRKYNALTWNSQFVKKVIYTLGDSEEDIRNKLVLGNHPYRNRSFAKEKPIEFSSKISQLNELDSEILQKLLKMFEIPDFKGEKMNIILLTSSFFTHSNNYKHNSSLTPFEEYLFPYLLLLDDVFKDKYRILVKPHPNNEISSLSMKQYLPDCIYVPGYVPSELLSHCNAIFSKGLSPGSNAILTFSLSDTFTLPRSYFFNLDLFLLKDLFVVLSKKLKCNSVVFYDKDPNLIDSFSVLSNYEMRTSLINDDCNSLVYHADLDNYINDSNSKVKITPFVNDYRLFADALVLIIDIESSNDSNTLQIGNPVFIIQTTADLLKILDCFEYTRLYSLSKFKLRARVIPLRDYLNKNLNLSIEYKLNILDKCLESYSTGSTSVDTIVSIFKLFVYAPNVPNKYRHSFFNILWRQINNKYDGELICLLNYMYYTKDNFAYRYHGWLLKNGRAENQDYNLAAEKLRVAYSKKVTRAVYELCNTLLLINSNESLLECEQVVKTLDLISDEKAIKIKKQLDVLKNKNN